MTDQAIVYTQRFPEETVEIETMAFPSVVREHARRFQPDLAPTSANLLLGFEGDSVTTSESAFSFFSLTGVGLIWIPIWSDQSELEGAYYELRRASIGGQSFNADADTSIRAQSWAGVQAQGN